MGATYIKRYNRRRANYAQWGCGCLLAGGFGMLIIFMIFYALWPALAGLTMQLSGANRVGETSQVFQDAVVPPTAVVSNPTSPEQVTINLGQFGRETIRVDQQSSAFVTGDSESGSRIARASFTEAVLLALCAQQSPICREGSDQYRNPAVDLRPGGAVIYADVNLGTLIWQRIGVVFQLDSTRTALRVIGIDIDGGLYDYNTLPAELGGRVDEIAHMMNEILRQMAVETGGERYTLSEIIIDDTNLTLILQ